MRKICYIVVLLLSILATFSCGRTFGDDPEVDKEDRKLEFGVLGGEKVVNILNRHGDRYDGTRFDVLNSDSYLVDTLNDGRIRYDKEWIKFILTPNYKSIQIIVSENKTASERKTQFGVLGMKLGFTIFITQRTE